MPYDSERKAPEAGSVSAPRTPTTYYAVYAPKFGNPTMFEQVVVSTSERVRDDCLDGSPDIVSGPHVFVSASERSSLQPTMTCEELHELGATPVNMEWPDVEQPQPREPRPTLAAMRNGEWLAL